MANKGVDILLLQKRIPYTLLQQDNPTNQLAIILPGKGYCVEKPLLYYSTGLLFNKNFDILHVNYEYKNQEISSSDEFITRIENDVNNVINEVLMDRQYEQFYLIGKSIGTIGLSSLIKREIFRSALVIWLTPLLTRDTVYHAMMQCKNRSLAIIGDQDPFYEEGRFKELLKNKYITLQLIEGVNHSLEKGEDTLQSIEHLKKVLMEIDIFTGS